MMHDDDWKKERKKETRSLITELVCGADTSLAS
jgi:hypothetical protein